MIECRHCNQYVQPVNNICPNCRHNVTAMIGIEGPISDENTKNEATLVICGIVIVVIIALFLMPSIVVVWIFQRADFSDAFSTAAGSIWGWLGSTAFWEVLALQMFANKKRIVVGSGAVATAIILIVWLAFGGGNKEATVVQVPPSDGQAAPKQGRQPTGEPEKDDTKSAKEAFEKGNSAIVKGDYDKAIADFTDAIRLESQNAEAYSYRGFAYWKKHDYDLAIADCNDAIRLDPKLASAYRNRGGAHAEMGDGDLAFADLTEAIRLDPKDAKAYFWRGLGYHANGHFDKAIADFTEAIRLDPKGAKAYLDRGKAYKMKGENAKAETDFDDAKKLGLNPP